MNYQNVMSKVIEQFQNTITIINKTTTYDSVYGDSVDSTTSTSTIAGVNSITGSEEWNKSGYFAPNDKIFFLKGTETINLHDEIVLDDTTYEVSEEPITHKIGNVVQHYEIRARRK